MKTKYFCRALHAAALSAAVSAPFLSSKLLGNVPDCISSATDIADKLKCLPDVQSSEVTPDGSLPRNVRQFELKFTQPLDHNHPKLATFNQRVVLLHRDVNEPMVLQTSGYAIFGVRESVITQSFQTNQIQIEHRFFQDSTPNPVRWEFLNVEQSAKDFHAITESLKQIYTKNWVNTGASKGGMTSVYHRWFFPTDLTGTVADVAPLSFSTSDERYVDFVNHAGGKNYQKCRDDLAGLQISLLSHRDELLPNIEGDYSFLGGKDIAFEHAVIEMPFIFWQYGNPESPEKGCKAIPIDGSLTQQYLYLKTINDLDGYTNSSIEKFIPYYYQAATELGNPANRTDHLQNLRRFDFTIDQYTPKNVKYSYSNQLMRNLETWIQDESESIMFVYGEFDPWSAGAFPMGRPDHDSYKFIAPAGNHGSKYKNLNSQDMAIASATLSRWLGKTQVMTKNLVEQESLEDFEFKMIRKLR